MHYGPDLTDPGSGSSFSHTRLLMICFLFCFFVVCMSAHIQYRLHILLYSIHFFKLAQLKFNKMKLEPPQQQQTPLTCLKTSCLTKP